MHFIGSGRVYPINWRWVGMIHLLVTIICLWFRSFTLQLLEGLGILIISGSLTASKKNSDMDMAMSFGHVYLLD